MGRLIRLQLEPKSAWLAMLARGTTWRCGVGLEMGVVAVRDLRAANRGLRTPTPPQPRPPQRVSKQPTHTGSLTAKATKICPMWC